MKKNQPPDAAALRRRAEERLKRQSPEGGGQQTESETARLVHELQVHQIELEMQNEELRQAHAQVETLLAQYTDLYDFAPTGYLTLDLEGAIRQVNLTGARLLGVERSRLVNRRFGLFVAEGDRRAFSDFLQQVFASQTTECCEVALPQEGLHPLVVQIEGTRSADGQECRAVVVDITGRKRAEEALRASWSRQKALLDAVPDIVMEVDSHKVYTWANQPGLDFFGEDVVGKEAAFYFDGEQDTYPEVAPLFDGDERVLFVESWQRQRDGQLRLLAWWCRALKDAQGTVIGALSTARDITDRRRAEDELRSARAFLDSVINAIADPVFVKDDQRRFVLVNDALCAIVGRPREGLLGEDGDDMFPKEQVEVFRKMDAGVLDTGEENVNEELISNSSSAEVRTIVTRKTSYVDPAGKRFLVGVIRDITERKRAEEALRESEERTTIAFRSIPDGLVISHMENGKIVEVNDGWHKVFGYSREEVIGKSALALKLFADSADRERAMALLRRQGSLRDFEVQIRQKSGALNTVLLSIEILQIQGEQYLLAVIQDINERKRAEKKIKSQLEELQRWQDVMLGREDRVQELKREVNELCRRTGETVRYPSQEAGPADAEAAKPNS